jgi:hypothetical protein
MGYFTVYGSIAHFSPRYMKLADQRFERLFSSLELAQTDPIADSHPPETMEITALVISWLASVRQRNGARRTDPFSRRDGRPLLTIVVAGLAPIVARTSPAFERR